MIIRKVKVTEYEYQAPINYVAGATEPDIQFQLTDYEIPSGATGRVYVGRSDGTFEYTVATISGNNVTVAPTSSMFSVKGAGAIQVTLYVGNEIVKNFAVPVYVHADLADDSAEAGSDVTGVFRAAEEEALADFQEQAEEIVQQVIESIPADYTELTEEVDELNERFLPIIKVKQIVFNQYGLNRNTGYVSGTNRLHSPLSSCNEGDSVLVPSGYKFAFFYYNQNGYVGNSYDNDGGWYETTEPKAIPFTGLFSIVLAKNSDQDFTEEECIALNGTVTLYSSNAVTVSGIKFGVGHIDTSNQPAYWGLHGNDYYFSDWSNQSTLCSTRWRTENIIKFYEGDTIEVKDGYRFYFFTYVNGTVTNGQWRTGKYVFSEDANVRILIDTVDSTKTYYTEWEDLNQIVAIFRNYKDTLLLNDNELIDKVNNLEKTTENISNVLLDEAPYMNISKEDADYNVQVETHVYEPVDDPNGTRIRLIFDLREYNGFYIESSSTYGAGVAHALFDTLEKATNASHNDAIEYINERFVTENSGEYHSGGYLTVSLCKSDSGVFSPDDRSAAFEALQLTITVPNKYNKRFNEIEDDLSKIKDVLTKNIVTFTKDDADYTIRVKTATTTPVDDPDGTRIRIIFNFTQYDNYKVVASCDYGRGVYCGLFGTLSDAVYANTSIAIEQASPSYVNQVDWTVGSEGYLSVSLAKSDNSKFTDADFAEALASLNLEITMLSELAVRFDEDEDAIEELGEHLRHHEKYGNTPYLYIGELINAQLTANGYVTGNEIAPYRLVMNNVVAFPSPDRTFKLAIDDRYVLGIRSGQSPSNLSSNLYWYQNGDTVQLDDSVRYYAIAFTWKENISGTYKVIPVTEAQNINCRLYYEYQHDIMSSNVQAEALLNAIRMTFPASGANDLYGNTVIAHTSDCHGDYTRVKNYLDFCAREKIDLACITGDIVAYHPINGLGWFHDLVKDTDAKVAICTGNHDVYDADKDDDDIYSYMFEPIAEELGDETGKSWYYTDLPNRLLRVISINLYQYGGGNRWYTHFTPSQLTWFINTLKSTPQRYGVIVLTHAPQITMSKTEGYGTFYQNVRKYNNSHNDVSGGVPVYDIIDAFISRTTLSKTYTQTGDYSEFTVDADFTNVPESVEFIAHLTGHYHMDTVCYIPGTQNKQLMLNVICTNSAYGAPAYGYLADLSDLPRNMVDYTQDAFNLYMIDRVNNVIHIIRVGSNKTYNLEDRVYMSIPYRD